MDIYAQMRQALEAKPIDYQTLAGLYQQAGVNRGLATTFMNRWRSPSVRQKLLSEVKKLLRKHPGKATPKSHNSGCSVNVKMIEQPDLPPGIPPEISQAIKARAKAANQRDAAGRKLVEKAYDLSKKERARLIASQKEHNAQAMHFHAIVKAWETDGTLPATEPVTAPPEALEAYEKQWKEAQRKRSRARSAIKKYGELEDQAKVEFHTARELEAQEELARIAPLLGKTFRK